MTNYFESPFKGIPLDRAGHATPTSIVGRYSYYSGYYHGHSFDDCARYLLAERRMPTGCSSAAFCSIGSGASLHHGRQPGPPERLGEHLPVRTTCPTQPQFADRAATAIFPAGDTVIGNDVWIGSEAVIMARCHRSATARCIGTRALVTK
jgi:chloramphenicol O-acetyltransferase type B